MKRILALLIAGLGWFGVITQLVIFLRNTEKDTLLTLWQFFSYFTILTNILVALYFSTYAAGKHFKALSAPLTAITVYILVVGMVYQIALRHLWNPTGLQRIVDEVLHSVNPLLVMVCWILHRPDGSLRYSNIPYWMIYPMAYLFFVLASGPFSKFYPYPFLNPLQVGVAGVVQSSITILFLLIALSVLLVFWGKKKAAYQSRQDQHLY